MMKSPDIANKKQITLEEFLSCVSKDKGILSVLNYYGIITEDDLRERFNGVDEEHQLPDCDSDLENEVKAERWNTSEEVAAPKVQSSEEKKEMLESTKLLTELAPKDIKIDEEAPDTSLDLEFIYGYRCWDVRNNLRYTNTGKVVYHTASAGIVYSPQEAKQQYFFEHKAHISCLALHPGLVYVATGDVGASPFVFVWDTGSMECVACMAGVLKKGVCHLAFSEDGKYLAAVGADDFHSIAIYEWEACKTANKDLRPRNEHVGLIASGQVSVTSPLCLVFSPNGQMVAAPGIQEVNFVAFANGAVKVRKGMGWGFIKKQTMLCGVYLDEDLITGTFSGELVIWTDCQRTKIMEAHKGLVYAICRRENGKGILTGGSDGMVIVWNKELSKDMMINIAENKALSCYVPKVRSVCEGPEGDILVGVRSGEIIEISQNKVRVLLRSHYKGEVRGLAVHPQQQKFVTFGQDGMLFDWNMNTRRVHKVLTAHTVVCQT